MILIIIIILLIILIHIDCDNIEAFTANPQLAGSIESKSILKNKYTGIDESLNINYNKIFDMYNYYEYPDDKIFDRPSNTKKFMNKRLIYTSERNNQKILKYEEELKKGLRDMLKKDIDDTKRIITVLPKGYEEIEQLPSQQYILGFDSHIPQIVKRSDPGSILNMCTGYWGKWENKEECTKQTPCKKVYRKWMFNNTGDDKDDCYTDNKGISNQRELIDLKKYNDLYNPGSLENRPTHIDLAPCNQVIDYSSKYDISGGECSDKGKCIDGNDTCECDSSGVGNNCELI